MSPKIQPDTTSTTGSGGGAAAAMVVTSLTLTEAETAVHLPPPPPHPHPAVSVSVPEPVNAHVEVNDAEESASNGYPSAILTCRPNSHPFQERTLLSVHDQVKIGRSVARSRPSENNAIFDCKVLSRNHALLWYKDGKFFLQDTKSSNGTFVNNARLSKGAEESDPREICSGDILQFGVDVQENAKKLTHGCIIATVRLFLPDGKEAKASPTINSASSATTLPQQDLYQLNQYIQEALVREQMLETKLAMLQRLVGQTNQASDDAWKSLIDEDRLLTRVEILESQLSTYGKAMTEDKLREEAKKLMEEKEVYQETAKQTLKKLVDEKLEALKKQKELEKELSNTEDEYACLKELHDQDVEQNRQLASQITQLSSELEEVKLKQEEVDKSDEPKNNASLKATATVSVDNDVERGKGEGQDAEDVLHHEVHEVHDVTAVLECQSEAVVKNNETVTESSSGDDEISRLESALKACRSDYEALVDCNASVSDTLSEVEGRLQDALAQLRQREETIRTLEEAAAAAAAATPSHEEDDDDDEVARLRSQVDTLSGEVKAMEVENDALKRQLEDAVSLPHVQDTTSALEKSLSDAELKIAELLKIKEKYAEVDAERTHLALNVTELEEEMDVLSFQTRTATACSLIPLVILVMAVIVAYLPSLSSAFGTAETL